MASLCYLEAASRLNPNLILTLNKYMMSIDELRSNAHKDKPIHVIM